MRHNNGMVMVHTISYTVLKFDEVVMNLLQCYRGNSYIVVYGLLDIARMQ